MERIIRILTTGKALSVIDQAIIDAIQGGSRVLVKAGSLLVNFPENNLVDKLESENRAVAGWAEGLSQEHGLVWQRVGLDVLFVRATA
ncbi:MAG: hypothetical protein ACRYFS_07925 [Janthinobacterium lividum]